MFILPSVVLFCWSHHYIHHESVEQEWVVSTKENCEVPASVSCWCSAQDVAMLSHCEELGWMSSFLSFLVMCVIELDRSSPYSWRRMCSTKEKLPMHSKCIYLLLRWVDMPYYSPVTCWPSRRSTWHFSNSICDNTILSVVRDGVPVNHFNESNHLEVNRNWI